MAWSNRLSLNTTKIELIFFHSKRRPIDYSSILIRFNGLKLISISYLSTEYHIHELSKKISRANGILSKLRYNSSFEVCLQVYYSLFYSHMVYGCNALGLSTEDNIYKIEVWRKKVQSYHDLLRL